ncbi:FKBP-type peptidyl-prolyl cis-trans isomerase [Botryobacter ruber]|uniref:FKBP-type peptidyl-prolyl cis-trans isomerase n=1 Tax=Botryobacter ruber TaxID=2171629 RepID=UPI0013E37A10|nr:FKBP-type peptidyl-prolyl cis-trans isomerase [Botryobacter ruber]
MPVIAGAFLFQACDKKSDKFYTTANGLEYKIFEKTDKGEYEPKGKVADNDTTGARIGQIVAVHMAIKNAEDSTLVDTREQKPAFPAFIPVMEPTMKGGLEEAIMMLSPGDSGVFKINADSLFAHTYRQPLPQEIKPGSKLTFFIKMEKVMTRAEAEVEQQKVMGEMQKAAQAQFLERLRTDSATVAQIGKDSVIIESYIKEKNLKNVQKSPMGVYYAVTQEGTGPKANTGDMVSVYYKLSFLDGKELESNFGKEPFTFPLGQGQVIPGWDDAFTQLKEGSKAILLVPSSLAYGAQERGPQMPANSILRFDVELVNVENQGSTAQNNPEQ